jgi:hypothetical protein
MEKITKKGTLTIRNHFKSKTQEEISFLIACMIANLINRDQEGIKKKGDTTDE